MLQSVADIGANKTLIPVSESARILKVVQDRKLFNGDFSGLSLGVIDTVTKAPAMNWFRRIATFFPEFLLSNNVSIEIANNERMQMLFEDQASRFFRILQRANIDMLRYGVGVIATHPLDPLSFIQYERDQHYEVVGVDGIVHTDVIAIHDPTYKAYNLLIYPVAGGARWERFTSNVGLTMGNHLGSIEIPDRVGRQVVSLEHNSDLRSIFDDVKEPLLQANRVAISVAKTLKRNLSPHLYGSDSMLIRDEAGQVEIKTDGMFLPLQQGDMPPGYLQWDSHIEAARWDYDKNIETALVLAGLSIAIFDANIRIGVLSGVAMRRIIAPFLARLGHYARINETAIVSVLRIWNNNRAKQNLEIFQFEDKDISVNWNYEEALGIVEELEGKQEEEQELDNGYGK